MIKKIAFGVLISILFISGARVVVFFLPRAFAEPDDPSMGIQTTINSGSLYKYNALDPVNTNSGTNQAQETPADISKKLDEIIKKEDISVKNAEDTIKKINETSEFKTFLIGNNLGTLKFELVQIEGGVDLLNNLYINTEDNSLKNQINKEIMILKDEQSKVEGFVVARENKFNLFGWLVASL